MYEPNYATRRTETRSGDAYEGLKGDADEFPPLGGLNGGADKFGRNKSGRLGWKYVMSRQSWIALSAATSCATALSAAAFSAPAFSTASSAAALAAANVRRIASSVEATTWIARTPRKSLGGEGSSWAEVRCTGTTAGTELGSAGALGALSKLDSQLVSYRWRCTTVPSPLPPSPPSQLVSHRWRCHKLGSGLKSEADT
jgi:hypothetical protein